MISNYKVRYEGRRWEILHGEYAGIEAFALDELQREVQRHLPYVVATRPANGADETTHRIIIGTPESNPLIARLVDAGGIAIPEAAEGYALRAGLDEVGTERRHLVLAGRDPKGVLNAVMEWCSRYNRLTHPIFDRPHDRRQAFDAMPEMQLQEAPAIARRGIWTWGYVIYDYRAFLDAMARLRFNALTIWNDCPPINFATVIDAAHARGIEVIAGFHWGWGMTGLDLTRQADRDAIRRDVVDRYLRDYRHADLDGIYFQTLTEHDTQIMNDGRSTAAVCTELVNEIATELLALDPGLRIEWGLHATSITQHLDDLRALRDEVIITWEDAGALPWSYDPILDQPAPPAKAGSTVAETLALSQQLMRLRPGSEFAMVPKGWTCLSWGTEFENHGPFILGERDREWIAHRAAERRTRWGWVDRAWLRDFSQALEFYRALLAEKPTVATVTALIEDGVIEAGVPVSVRLLAESLWNPRRPDAEILNAAMSPWWDR